MAASPGWRGLLALHLDYAAPGVLTLPTNPRVGTQILLWQSSANVVTADAGTNNIVSAGSFGTTLPLVQHRPVHLTFFVVPGPSGFWIASA